MEEIRAEIGRLIDEGELTLLDIEENIVSRFGEEYRGVVVTVMEDRWVEQNS